MEAGCHSPWISRHLEGAGCEVVVSNPRKTRAIYQHERKSDRRDALMLARIARMEPALLYPVRHGSEEAQQDLLRIKLGDSLVRARVGLINSLRFTLKSLGYTIANPSTERFHKVIESALPESVVQMIAPRVQAIEELSFRIKVLDREIRILAHIKYPETSWLEHIPGVGPITALYFVLKIGDPARFERVPSSDYVRAGTKGERTIRSCASANVLTPTCDGSWSARLSIFWDRSRLRALCVSTD